jgi:hypothetical protein
MHLFVNETSAGFYTREVYYQFEGRESCPSQDGGTVQHDVTVAAHIRK